MQIKDIIRHGQQRPLEIIGDFLGDRPSRVAGENTVHIAAIDGRGARGRPEGGVIHRRHDNHPARNVGKLDLIRQVEQRNRPLILIAVIAAREQGRWAVAAFHDGDRDHQ